MMATSEIFSDLLRGLPASVADAIKSAMVVTTYPPGVYLFHTGDTPDSLYLLKEGLVKISYGNLNGDEKIVEITQAGDVFGEMFLGQYRFRIGSAIALDQVQVARLYENDVIRLIQTHPEFALRLVQYLADSKRQTLARLHALMHMDARHRLLGTLLNLTRQHCCAYGNWYKVPATLTQEDIANLACLNRSTVNVLVNDLRRQNVLGGSGRTLLINRPAVVSLLEADGTEILE